MLFLRMYTYLPRKGKKTKINGNKFVATEMLKILVCSASEAELEALFQNLKDSKIHVFFFLNGMEHMHPQTPVATVYQQKLLMMALKSTYRLDENAFLLKC